MGFIKYLLLAVFLLAGCTRVFGQEDIPTPEQVRENIRKAEQGNAEAQSVLGLMYSLGLGVPKDDQEAIKWFRKAAEQGYAHGQFSLGVSYRLGEGVPQDYQLAIKWFRKAAEQGQANAQSILGVMYESGKGVLKDYVLAYKWYNLAATQGDKNSAKFRDDLAKKMTPSQIAEAQKLSREFKPKKEKPKK